MNTTIPRQPVRLLCGRPVGAIGLGCMNLNHAYGEPPSTEEGLRLLQRAFELGVTHFDTAALYGFGRNEELLGRWLPAIRNQVFLASKCGMTPVEGRRVIDGRPATLKATLQESLARLRTDHIDLYYLHRWDKRIPIEDSVGALADLVRAGHIGAIGLSEVSAATLRKAHAVHPIAALQTEYSLWARNAEVAVLEECRRLGVAFVAFSPVGRGFLADGIRDPAAFSRGDIRRTMPRFQTPHWESNAALLDRYRELAHAAGCTPAQLALAWVLSRGTDILPIPGTRSIAHLEEDLAAASLVLPPDVLAAADALVNDRTVSGPRYAPSVLAEVDTEEWPA
ncbi:MAG: aldo/keto reductase [Gammaproteobacteria bacterium]